MVRASDDGTNAREIRYEDRLGEARLRPHAKLPVIVFPPAADTASRGCRTAVAASAGECAHNAEGAHYAWRRRGAAHVRLAQFYRREQDTGNSNRNEYILSGSGTEHAEGILAPAVGHAVGRQCATRPTPCGNASERRIPLHAGGQQNVTRLCSLAQLPRRVVPPTPHLRRRRHPARVPEAGGDLDEPLRSPHERWVATLDRRAIAYLAMVVAPPAPHRAGTFESTRMALTTRDLRKAPVGRHRHRRVAATLIVADAQAAFPIVSPAVRRTVCSQTARVKLPPFQRNKPEASRHSHRREVVRRPVSRADTTPRVVPPAEGLTARRQRT